MRRDRAAVIGGCLTRAASPPHFHDRLTQSVGCDSLPDDDPRRTYVEFTLEAIGAGTRLTVVESGFAQMPPDAYRVAFDANTEGWASELAELADYLDAA